MIWFSVFFFLSGLCSIVYELVWLRLSMAKFGVTTALVSIVLSVFMAGLGLGSWLAGTSLRRWGSRLRRSPLLLYGICEALIGLSALLVPFELAWGGRLLTDVAGRVAISSGSYYLLSGGWLALVLIPWSTCMGATLPLAMFAIRRENRTDSERSFSFLYLSNVLGAVGGACVAPVLIELYGFRGTLKTAALLNGLIFAAAFLLSLQGRPEAAASASGEVPRGISVSRDRKLLLLLFATGLTTMAMEVVWTRLFTVFIGPLVYSFAKILATYLAATYIGSQVYRRWSRNRREDESRAWWLLLAFFGLLPLLTADPRVALSPGIRIFLGIFPFAAIAGFLTPMLVDRWSMGDPDRAGRGYAVNVIGCILGPLLAGFVLLPRFGEHTSLLLLGVPWFGIAFLAGSKRESRSLSYAAAAVLGVLAVLLATFTKDYEVLYPEAVVLRDNTATVVAAGTGMQKRLLVNGLGMTFLTTETKMMAHLTLSHLPAPPRNVLILCFGMGTTFRSALAWNIPVTAVELVPSVPKVFSYYHADGDRLLASARAHVVIDDGRRFLDRSPERFDAIILDPPPPISAAGSSLLYSREFLLLAREHLTEHGILQHWMARGDAADVASITRALTEVFPYVRVYGSGNMPNGMHFLASKSPIDDATPAELLARMPATAVADMMEWLPNITPEQQLTAATAKQISPAQLIALSPGIPAMQDDRPINEYDWLRGLFPRLMTGNHTAPAIAMEKTSH